MGMFDLEGGSTVSRRSSRHHTSSKHRDRDEKHRLRGLEVKKSRSRSRSRSRAPSVNITARSFFGLDNGDSRHDRHDRHDRHERKERHHSSHSRKPSNASFFSLPNVSSRSIFSSFGKATGVGGTSSYYRRSPRSSFLQRAYKKLKRLLRDLIYYAKKHPFKVFMLAIMPLITGGALTALLARFGMRLPQALERMMGMGARAMSGDSVGLVGEAVRMAAVAGGGGAAARGAAARGVTTSLERGRRGDLQWERRSTERDYFGGNNSRPFDTRSEAGSGWGGSLAGITKMFS